MKWNYFCFRIVLFIFFLPVTVYSGPAADLENEFIQVSEVAGKAVVTVHSTKIIVSQHAFRNTPFNDPFFNEFFKDFFGPVPEKEKKQRMRGLGSGFIIDEKGYILTNDHVVEDSDEIEVILSDGRKFPAKIVGADKRSDVAVLKIEGEDLPILKMGNSDKLRIGQWTVAVGNPFGHIVKNPDPTVTVGVVSALHRSLDLGAKDGRFYGNLIQTDAAINRGNSGGPLLNLKGEVIGINTLIFSTTGGYQGIGFAIPVNKARRIYEKIIKGTKITYPWLGIWIQPLNKEIMRQFQFDSEGKGALIFKVEKESPAEKAGLKKGDVILRIGTKDIRNPHDLVNIVSDLEVGQKVRIELIRDGEQDVMEAEVGARPVETLASGKQADQEDMPDKKASWRGIVVENIKPHHEKKAQSGVIVQHIAPQSPAHFSGMREGQIIDEVNRQPVRSKEEFTSLTKGLKGKVLIHTDAGYFVIGEEKKEEDN